MQRWTRVAHTVTAILVATALWAPPSVRAANVIHVPGDFTTIQAAIDAASAGDTVRVDAGTYHERIQILKDVVVESASGAGSTTIDGDVGGTVVFISTPPGAHPTLRGFTVTDGYEGSGAGGVSVFGDAIVEDNHIVDNFGCTGGGIAATGAAVIRDNYVARNRHACSGGTGGGIAVVGAGTVKVAGNTIVDNVADAGGGGIELNGAGAPTIERNVISGNHGQGGGGIELGNQSDALIVNNLISANDAYWGGGILWSTPLGTTGPTLRNNTVVGNTAVVGSGIYANGFDAGVQVTNNVITASGSVAAVECATDFDPTPPTFSHNDAWNPSGPEYSTACLSPTGSNGNVSADPKFLDPAAGDYHLRPDSSLIDIGLNAGAPATDIDGDARPFDGDGNGVATVDPGFDEVTDLILVVPTLVDFGDVGVGVVASPIGVTLTNFGVAPVTVDDASLDGTDAADFSIASDTCTTGPVGVHATCTVGVRLTPTDFGARSATLTLSGPAPVGTRTIPLAGTGVVPPSGVAWAAAKHAGPAYTWNGGGALGRTVQSGSQRLHLAYGTDRIGSHWATDKGPHVGVYYVRSTSGSNWTAPKRLNPSSQHAARLGLAAAGSRVYVTWASQTKIVKYSGKASRVLYVRVNKKHGASSAWKKTIRLTSKTGRVDYPTIAAAGNDAYVAWTDSNSGAIKVAVSRDRGGSWKTATVGSASASSASGRSGLPWVAASGATVAVVWLADAGGTVMARISTDHGKTWAPADVVGSDAVGPAGAAVRGSRVAVAWTTATDVVVRQNVSGVWGSPLVVASVAASTSTPYAVAVALQDPDRIGVSWAQPDATHAGRWNLRWAESANGGSLWFATQTLGASNAAATRVNDWPSVVWSSAGSRFIAWNAWTPGSSRYRLLLRRGVGTPVGPVLPAAMWHPARDGATGPSASPAAVGTRGAAGIRQRS